MDESDGARTEAEPQEQGGVRYTAGKRGQAWVSGGAAASPGSSEQKDAAWKEGNTAQSNPSGMAEKHSAAGCPEDRSAMPHPGIRNP